jgi:CBS domain-containing membrane protein
MTATETAPVLCVADLMTLEPIVVRETDSVAFAETVLRDFRISGLPVVDSSGRLVGVFSETDSLYLKVPSVSGLLRGKLGDPRVGEVMSRPPITVNSVASIETAAATMIEHSVHRLVAVDDEGRPIGVLSAIDFVRLAAEGSGS